MNKIEQIIDQLQRVFDQDKSEIVKTHFFISLSDLDGIKDYKLIFDKINNKSWPICHIRQFNEDSINAKYDISHNDKIVIHFIFYYNDSTFLNKDFFENVSLSSSERIWGNPSEIDVKILDLLK